MATTDYDAPRPSSIEDPDTESLDAIATARKETQSPNVDLDEATPSTAWNYPAPTCPGRS